MSGSPGELGQEVPDDVAARGRELVSRLATLVRNAHVHEPANRAWASLITGFSKTIYANLKQNHGSVMLTINNGQVSIDQYEIRPAFGDYNAFNYLVQDLSRLRIAGLRFRPPVNDVEIKKLVYAIAEFTASKDPSFDSLWERLRTQGVRSIELHRAEGDRLDSGTGDRRAEALRVFLSGMSSIRDVMQNVREGKTVGLRRAKRFVHSAVDLLASERSLALSLTTIKNYRNYLHNHAVNVSLISLLVGAKMGFDRRRLADLGLAALLREVGKATLPDELLEKEGELSPADWEKLKLFPYAGVSGLLRFRAFHTRTLRQVLVAFEHQFHSAEQRTITGRDFTLFSRIALLASAYDAMTSPRPYRERPFTPDQAVRQLIQDQEKHGVDARLLKVFVHAMGLYPVGTVVYLDTGEIGIVSDPPFDFDSIVRPRVLLISDQNDKEFLTPTRAETTALDTKGNYLRTIVQTVDAWRYGVNVPRHLLDVDTDEVLE